MPIQPKKIVLAISLALSISNSHAQFNAELNLLDLNGVNGFKINGVNADDYSGRSVSYAGDINGDGIDDVIIGANKADPNGNSNAGSSYVVFGSANGLPHPLNLSSLNGTNGFVINGVNEDDQSGISVSYAGDFNGDGIDDLIIGAGNADPNGINLAGSSYVVFGKTSGFPSQFNLSSINGFNGIVINGKGSGDKSGRSVSYAGDVNGDGIDDLIIGADSAQPNGIINAGSSYVVFGSDSGLPSPYNLITINGVNGFVINGINPSDQTGHSVSSAGDINGDGIDDVIIGERYSSPNGITNVDRSYVVFGSDAGITHPFNLSSLNGSNGFFINGTNYNDRTGFSVSQAGDVNGDGFDDLIVGAIYGSSIVNSFVGNSYVIYGRKEMFPTNVNVLTLNGLNGFVINGANTEDRFGYSVSKAGDINGDGIDDLIIGAKLADPNARSAAGSSYVIFGSQAGLPNPFDLSDLDGNNGFVINGIAVSDFSGSSVSYTGDINADGVDDVIIGAPGARVNLNLDAGASYVVYGREKPIFVNGFE